MTPTVSGCVLADDFSIGGTDASPLISIGGHIILGVYPNGLGTTTTAEEKLAEIAAIGRKLTAQAEARLAVIHPPAPVPVSEFDEPHKIGATA